LLDGRTSNRVVEILSAVYGELDIDTEHIGRLVYCAQKGAGRREWTEQKTELLLSLTCGRWNRWDIIAGRFMCRTEAGVQRKARALPRVRARTPC
jgi:hypothetical protein